MSESPVNVVVCPDGTNTLLVPESPVPCALGGDTSLIDDQLHPDAATSIDDTPAQTQLFATADHIPEPSSDSELADLTSEKRLSAEEAAELAWLAETHRVIVLRLKQWVIPVSGLLSFLLAVLFEAGMVTMVWWLLHWHPLGGGGGNMQRSGGSSTAVGGIIQSSGLNTLPSNPVKRWRPGRLPTPPSLPDKPLWTPHSRALAVLDNANPLNITLPVIGINSNHQAWLAPSHTVAPKTPHFKISQRDDPGRHSHTRTRGPQPNSRGLQPDATGGGRGGRPIQLFKPGTKTGLGSATGSGPGRGRGAGVGGGGSIVKPPPNPIMPLKYQFAWPAHLVNPRFQLTIRRDGSVASVKVLRSSGHPGIDQAIINALMQARFLPDIVGGKPVQSKFVISYNLSS